MSLQEPTDSQKAFFYQAIATGKTTILKKLLAKGIDAPISALQLLSLIRSKKKKIVQLIADECQDVEVTNDVLIRCLKNQWQKTLSSLVRRKEYNFIDLTDNKCLVTIISFGDRELSRRALASNKIDFHGPNSEVLIYLCKEGETDLVRHLLYTKNIDPNYGDCIFMKTAIRSNSKEIVELFKRFGGYEETDRMKRFEYSCNPNFGI